MGYDNENARRLVFDIETAPLDDAGDYLEPADAPANYKDPVKIAAYIEEKRVEALGKCSLDVDLCRVVAIGTWLEGETIQTDLVKGGDDDERSLLLAFWALTQGRHLVGFNCLGFDLPVLLRRSLYLGVPLPNLSIDKYRHPQITDVLDVLSFAGKLRLRGLAFYCKRFGISGPADALTGAEIPQAVAEGRWDAIEAHVKADVQKTGALAAKMGAFSLQPLAEAVA